MQSLNLKDYIKVYNILDKNYINSIVSSLQPEELWQKQPWTNREYKFVLSEGDEDICVSYGASEGQTSYVMQNIHTALHKYFSEVNSSIAEFAAWNGYSEVRYNRYQKGQAIVRHIDDIYSLFDGTRRGVPILSVVGLLNDDFAGGDFIMFDDYKVNLKAGDIMIFPSSFTFPHHVTHVTEGTRYSFVSWVW